MVAALAASALGGCALIDQTTFVTAPPPRLTIQAAAPLSPKVAIDARIPLLVVGPATRLSDYPVLLRPALRAAQRRNPAVRFDVTAVAGRGDMNAATEQAAAVMRAMAEDGVARHRMLLRAVEDAGHPGHEVRVYLR